MSTDVKESYSVAEAAEILGVTEKRVRTLIGQKRLDADKNRYRMWEITAESLHNMVRGDRESMTMRERVSALEERVDALERGRPSETPVELAEAPKTVAEEPEQPDPEPEETPITSTEIITSMIEFFSDPQRRAIRAHSPPNLSLIHISEPTRPY